jgi:adenosylhomocysteine nucleosidase
MPSASDRAAPDPRSSSLGLTVIAPLGVERACLSVTDSALGVVQSGPGCDRAREAASRAIAAGARALLSWGLAGALAPSLRPGDVLLPREIVAGNGAHYEATPSWHAALAAALEPDFDVVCGPLLSVAEVLSTPDAKAAAARATAAVACDMESSAVAAVARAAAVPFVALRVVVDGAHDALPGDIARWVDDAGNPLLGPVLAGLIRPQQWRAIWTMSRRFRRARDSMRRVAGHLAPVAFLWASTAANAA